MASAARSPARRRSDLICSKVIGPWRKSQVVVAGDHRRHEPFNLSKVCVMDVRPHGWQHARRQRSQRQRGVDREAFPNPCAGRIERATTANLFIPIVTGSDCQPLNR